MLGPWLLLWTVAFLDRFKNLCDAFEKFPRAVTSGIERSDRLTSFDSLDFSNNCGDDIFNLGIYTEIVERINPSAIVGTFTVGGSAAAAGSAGPQTGLRPVIRKTLGELLRLSYQINCPRHDLIVVDGRLLGRQHLPLWIGSSLKIWPLIPVTFKPGKRNPVARDLRTKLAGALSKSLEQSASPSPLISAIAELTAVHLPDVFVESYASLCEFSERLYPRKPKAIFSTNHLFFDEAFKHWAAKSADEGTKIVYGQHGGNEAFCAFDPICDHDLSVPDLYCAWGAPGKPHAPGQCFGPPIGIPKIQWAGNTRSANNFILFGSTHTFRFRHILVPIFSPNRFEAYLQRQKRFAEALEKPLRARLKVRVLYDYLGWDICRRWADSCPEAEIDDANVPFSDSISKCALYVCDHLMTTYIQSLQANVPTVLFWDEGDYAVPKTSMAAIADLRDAGILHASPESAADTVNREFENIDTWWMAEHRQRAKDRFVQSYAPVHDNPSEFWGKKLLSFVNGGEQ